MPIIPSDSTLGYTRQRLRRKHSRPLHCPACYTPFTDEGKRDQHIRERSCAPAEVREIEGVSNEQWRRLEKRASVKNSLEENWYLTYEILFPQCERPKSPYLDTTICEHIEFIKDFVDAEGGALAREIVLSFVTIEGLPRENQVEYWGRRLLERFLRIKIEEMSSRDEPLSGPSLERQLSAANRQLPTPSSAGRSSPVAPHSTMSSQIQTTAAESLNLSSNGSHHDASSLLLSSIHQEIVSEVSKSREDMWSQGPAYQSFNFEGTDMHAPFSEIIPDIDPSLYYSLFPNDTGLVRTINENIVPFDLKADRTVSNVSSTD